VKKNLLLIVGMLFIMITPCFIIYSEFTPKSFNKIAIELKDGEKYDFRKNLGLEIIDKPYYTDRDVEYNDSTIFNTNNFKFVKSPIIRSLETNDNNASDIIRFVNLSIDNDYLTYLDILDVDGDYLPEESLAFRNISEIPADEKSLYFTNYCRSLFKNSTARKILFDDGLNVVKNYCSIVPNDFRKRVQSELDNLLSFTNTLPTLTYNESKRFEDYWKGFIYRRYFTDKVPIIEIQNNLIRAKKELKALNLIFDYSYEVFINNEISVFVSQFGFALYSHSNNKLIRFNNQYLLGLSYFKDENGSFYSISKHEERCKYCGEEKIRTHYSIKKLLYDSKLNLIE